MEVFYERRSLNLFLGKVEKVERERRDGTTETIFVHAGCGGQIKQLKYICRVIFPTNHNTEAGGSMKYEPSEQAPRKLPVIFLFCAKCDERPGPPSDGKLMVESDIVNLTSDLSK